MTSVHTRAKQPRSMKHANWLTPFPYLVKGKTGGVSRSSCAPSPSPRGERFYPSWVITSVPAFLQGILVRTAPPTGCYGAIFRISIG